MVVHMDAGELGASSVYRHFRYVQTMGFVHYLRGRKSRLDVRAPGRPAVPYAVGNVAEDAQAAEPLAGRARLDVRANPASRYVSAP
jgi:hypothetical protein